LILRSAAESFTPGALGVVMSKIVVAALLLCTLVACAGYKKSLNSVPPPRAATPVLYKFSDKALSARLATIVLDLPVGYEYGELSFGLWGGCANKRKLINTNGRIRLDEKRYVDIFTNVMKSHGYPVDEDREMFKDTSDRVADLQVGARVIEAAINQCYPETTKSQQRGSGSASFKIEWSVYSMIEKKIVYTTTNTGSTYGEVETEIGETGILRPAFAEALERLAADDRYRALADNNDAASAAASPAVARIHVPRTKAFSGGLTANLAAMRKSVATITANKGMGSGFALAAGLVLTAEHVVTGSKYAKIKLATGKECYGEVFASSKARDVALLKVDCPDLAPLPTIRNKPAEGGEVFAIGTPLSKDLQFTVTKGIVSGLRKIDDLDYIQSDVNVLPGNSGGPLVDSHGNVVGVTTRGATLSSVPAGLNFFVPVADLGRYLPVDFD
jgi:S1-C subfamily serine protease